nr:MAG TPA: hypothetical protein [Caudoviricetes sp.]
MLLPAGMPVEKSEKKNWKAKAFCKLLKGGHI